MNLWQLIILHIVSKLVAPIFQNFKLVPSSYLKSLYTPSIFILTDSFHSECATYTLIPSKVLLHFIFLFEIWYKVEYLNHYWHYFVSFISSKFQFRLVLNYLKLLMHQHLINFFVSYVLDNFSCFFRYSLFSNFAVLSKHFD